jgi:hypothetical protein
MLASRIARHPISSPTERETVGSIIVTVPDIQYADLIYNEEETRIILKYFWPDSSGKVDSVTINDDIRAFAQLALIIAVDGSYAMGYVNLLADAVIQRILRPNGDVLVLARRLGRNYVRHWWRHATQRDLETARIYYTVRDSVAYQLGGRMQILLSDGVALRRGSTTVVLMKTSSASA